MNHVNLQEILDSQMFVQQNDVIISFSILMDLVEMESSTFTEPSLTLSMSLRLPLISAIHSFVTINNTDIISSRKASDYFIQTHSLTWTCTSETSVMRYYRSMNRMFRQFVFSFATTSITVNQFHHEPNWIWKAQGTISGFLLSSSPYVLSICLLQIGTFTVLAEVKPGVLCFNLTGPVVTISPMSM